MVLTDKNLQSIKQVIKMINDNANINKIGKCLDSNPDITKALAKHYAVYVKTVFYNNIDRLITFNIYNHKYLDDPHSVVSEIKDASNVYKNFTYPIIQGSPNDIGTLAGTPIHVDYTDEVNLTALKKDLVTLVKDASNHK